MNYVWYVKKSLNYECVLGKGNMVFHNFVPIIPVFHLTGDFPYFLRRAPGRELWNCGDRVIKRHLSRQGSNVSLPSFFNSGRFVFFTYCVSLPDFIERSWWLIHFEIYDLGKTISSSHATQFCCRQLSIKHVLQLFACLCSWFIFFQLGKPIPLSLSTIYLPMEYPLPRLSSKHMIKIKVEIESVIVNRN